MLGAVFEREALITPRTRGFFVARAVGSGLLLAIVATCWLLVTGSHAVATVGDTARFAATLFRILAPLQLTLAMLAAALTAVVAVSVEKDRRTLELLLVSRLSDAQLVVGKFLGSAVRVLLMLLAAVPVFAIAALYGGIEPLQVARVFAVTVLAAVAAAGLANAVAFWRDTSFQSLAFTIFLLVAWTAVGEAVAAGWGAAAGAAVSPARAVFAAVAPAAAAPVWPFAGFCLTTILAATGLAVARVRPWNVARDRRAAATAPARVAPRPSRRIWRNPVLWRELCTRAHGRTMTVVRVAWVLLFGLAIAGVVGAGRAERADRLAVAVAVVPVALASLLAVAALGVTSITGERDRGCLDLLLVSDLDPAEFVWGKLWGVLGSGREMVLLPLLLCGLLVPLGIATVEQGLALAAGLALLLFFAATLGIYAGLSHPVSRQAIAVALGTVAFLCVGVATAMRIMVAFASSFELQLAPFLAVIVGGAVGLYAALSARNPSAAVAWAAALLPALTFVAITDFLQGGTLQVLLIVAAAYGFAILALLVPSIGAFDQLTGRT
jgi:ABC-type transport system involved in multi-copper enzyme maturation permease subunit